MNRSWVLRLIAAVAIGAALRFVVNLEPLWWLAWIVPGLLLALALATESHQVRWLVLGAALIGTSANFPYFTKVMPLLPALLVVLGQAMLWMFTVMAARRVLRATRRGWGLLAFPVLWVAVDTLLAHLTPDGNWGSLAYSQADVPAIAQLASLVGMAGILFLLTLAASVMAALLVRSARPRSTGFVAGLFVLLLGATLLFGTLRLRGSQQHAEATYGLAVIDDAIGLEASAAYSQPIWARYEQQVALLAARGAGVILLPEKIALLREPDARARQHWLSALARQHGVWLLAGVGVVGSVDKRNEAWLFAPDGTLSTNYLKHHMAPPEREFVAGNDFPVRHFASADHGVAICKDMHFARLGREFGRRGAQVMLVPAWDFRDDERLAERMTRMRGVESGFSVVRNARDGLLSVSDPFGRLLAQSSSRSLPGETLLVKVSLPVQVRTFYARSGDVLGWLGVAAALLMLLAPAMLARGGSLRLRL